MSGRTGGLAEGILQPGANVVWQSKWKGNLAVFTTPLPALAEPRAILPECPGRGHGEAGHPRQRCLCFCAANRECPKPKTVHLEEATECPTTRRSPRRRRAT